LPPVCDIPLYSSREGVTGIELVGLNSYATLDRIIYLKQPMRQLDSEDRFRALLENVRLGQMTQVDVDLLNTREISRLNDNEMREFTNAIMVFADRGSKDACDMLVN